MYSYINNTFFLAGLPTAQSQDLVTPTSPLVLVDHWGKTFKILMQKRSSMNQSLYLSWDAARLYTHLKV